MGALRTDIKVMTSRPESWEEYVETIERQFGVGEVATRLLNKFVSAMPGRPVGGLFLCTRCRTGSIREGRDVDALMTFVGSGCCDCAGCTIEGGRFKSHAKHPSWDAYLAWVHQELMKG